MPISNTSQLGLIRLGLAQLGVVEPDTASGGISVADSSSLAESVSVSVVGAPWLLETSVFDAAAAAESTSWQIGVDLSVFDSAVVAESVTIGNNVSVFDAAAVAESITLSLRSANSSLMLLGVG